MRPVLIIVSIVVAIIVAAIVARYMGVGPPPAAAAVTESRDAARLEIPASIRREHKELHDRLSRAIKVGGKTGEAAEHVEDLLHPHFMKEEKYALPPLGMLRAFSDGEVPANAEEVLALTEKFRAEYPRMLVEHEAIVEALGQLVVVARNEGHTEVADFAQDLMRHAESEEEILYPTTVLIGEYLKLMTAKDPPPLRTSLSAR